MDYEATQTLIRRLRSDLQHSKAAELAGALSKQLREQADKLIADSRLQVLEGSQATLAPRITESATKVSHSAAGEAFMLAPTAASWLLLLPGMANGRAELDLESLTLRMELVSKSSGSTLAQVVAEARSIYQKQDSADFAVAGSVDDSPASPSSESTDNGWTATGNVSITKGFPSVPESNNPLPASEVEG